MVESVHCSKRMCHYGADVTDLALCMVCYYMQVLFLLEDF